MASSITSFGGGSKQSLTGSTKSKSETVNYLLLYEAMVRHQDLEFDATHDHIGLTVERIQYLGRKSLTGSTSPSKASSNNTNNTPELMDEDDEGPKGMLTYLQMRRCLLRLGYTWNRSLPPANSDSYDDDVSVMSSNSASTFISGGGASNASSVMSTRDIIATDAQLIMLLTTLVEMEERHRAVKIANYDEDDDDEEEDMDEDGIYSRGLFLPEFIQAYKLIIGGMQSLQTYPSPDDSPALLQKACAALGIMPVDKTALQDLRVRSRERTLGLLRLFGPDSKLYKDYDVMAIQSAGESPTSRSKTRDGLQSTPNRTKKASKVAASNNSKSTSGRGNMMAKDGLLPRLTEEEIRKMVHSKDTALAQILEDHESEMNVMATNMEELRLKGLNTQKLIKRRRKRTRLAAIMGLVLVAIGGGVYELQRREQVKVEIATGREAERQADSTTIAELKGNVASLTSKLSDAEATIRYEENRYDDVKKKYGKIVKSLEETEGKWLVDQRELERCRVTRKELDLELTTTTGRNEEIEEEVSWCRERLSTTERAMEGMERALKKSRESAAAAVAAGGGEAGANVKVPSFADIAKEIQDEDGKKGLVALDNKKKGKKDSSEDRDGKKGGSKHKPVQMEMKYNKSFRNAVILRQVYSAVGGMVVSALFPGIAKIFGLLFLR